MSGHEERCRNENETTRARTSIALHQNFDNTSPLLIDTLLQELERFLRLFELEGMGDELVNAGQAAFAEQLDSFGVGVGVSE